MTADPFFGPHAIVAPPAGSDRPQEGPTPVADLCAMFRDPRYWRDRDPEFCAKASEAFRKLVGGS